MTATPHGGLRTVPPVPVAARAPRPAPRTSEEGWVAVAAELAAIPHLAYALLAEHRATEHGLCRACTRAGRGTPYLPWPCSITALARESIEHIGRARERTAAARQLGDQATDPGQ
jgi:hypothetical protein